MVQKSGVHQLRLVVFPIIYNGFIYARWLAGFLPTVPLGSLFDPCCKHRRKISPLSKLDRSDFIAKKVDMLEENSDKTSQPLLVGG